MSALTEFFRALLKDAETEEQKILTNESTETTENAQTVVTEVKEPVGYSEVERLRKELAQAQQLNRELLNRADVTNNQSTSFSEIMREQSYHPLYTERR